jgi:hypothetical protein
VRIERFEQKNLHGQYTNRRPDRVGGFLFARIPGANPKRKLTMKETLSIRILAENPDHHLWNNNGTFWCHYTLHLPDYTKRRVRRSLKTSSIQRARKRRDQLLHGARKGATL